MNKQAIKKYKKELPIMLDDFKLLCRETRDAKREHDWYNKELDKERKKIHTRLRHLIKELTPREQKVIEMRWGLNEMGSCTLEEVAREFSVTRERIRNIEQRAFENMVKIV